MLAKILVVLGGPTLVTLVPMSASPGMAGMAAEFGRSGDGATFAQMVMTVPAIMTVVSASLAGIGAEMIGRRRLLLVSLMLYVIGGLACFFARDAALLIAARLVLGFASGGILTTSLALAGDFPEGGRRERLLGFIVTTTSASAVIMVTLGGYMVDAFGWRSAFLVYLFGLPLIPIAWLGLRDHAHPHHDHNLLSPVRLLWPIYLLLIAFVVGMFMVPVQGQFLLLGDGLSSAGSRGWMVSIFSGVALLSSACFGLMCRYLGPRGLLALVACGYGVGSLLAGAIHDMAATAIGFAFAGVSAGLTEPATAMIVLSRAPESMRSRATGLLLSALFLGQFLNPLVVSPLRSAFGVHGAFVVIGAFFVVLGLFVLLCAPRLGPTLGPDHVLRAQRPVS